MIKTTCPQCGAEFQVSEKLVAGKVVRFRCRKCGGALVVDGSEVEESSAASSSKQPKETSVGRQSQLLSMVPDEAPIPPVTKDNDTPETIAKSGKGSKSGPHSTRDITSEDEPTTMMEPKKAQSATPSVIQGKEDAPPSSARLSRISMDINSVFQVPPAAQEEDWDVPIDLDDDEASSDEPEFEEELELESIPPSERIDLQALLSTSRKAPPPPKLPHGAPSAATPKVSPPVPLTAANIAPAPVPMPAPGDEPPPSAPIPLTQTRPPGAKSPSDALLAPVSGIDGVEDVEIPPSASVPKDVKTLSKKMDAVSRRQDQDNAGFKKIGIWLLVVGGLSALGFGAYRLGQRTASTTEPQASSVRPAAHPSLDAGRSSAVPEHAREVASARQTPVPPTTGESNKQPAPTTGGNKPTTHEARTPPSQKQPTAESPQPTTAPTSESAKTAPAVPKSPEKTGPKSAAVPVKTAKTPDTSSSDSAPPFNRRAAASAISALKGSAASCKRPGGPQGNARVAITFAPSGRATVAMVQGPPFAGTPTGGCIAARMRAARIPAFSGPSVTVRTSVPVF